VKARFTTQRRRRDIFVESSSSGCRSSVGAAYSDAAPMGSKNFVGSRCYKDIAPTVLPHGSQHRIVADLDAILDRAGKGES